LCAHGVVWRSSKCFTQLESTKILTCTRPTAHTGTPPHPTTADACASRMNPYKQAFCQGPPKPPFARTCSDVLCAHGGVWCPPGVCVCVCVCCCKATRTPHIHTTNPTRWHPSALDPRFVTTCGAEVVKSTRHKFVRAMTLAESHKLLQHPFEPHVNT
jgi:hypothetical protein